MLFDAPIVWKKEVGNHAETLKNNYEFYFNKCAEHSKHGLDMRDPPHF